MLWFCSTKGRTSFLVNHATKEGAIAIATEEQDGEAPAVMQALPDGAFRADVEDDGGDDDDVTVAVDAGTCAILTELEESAVMFLEESANNGKRPGRSRCLSEADAAPGRVVVCEKPAAHLGEHEAEGMVWT